jgi:hypothetical protein
MKTLLLATALCLTGCATNPLDYGSRHHERGDIALDLKLRTPEEPIEVVAATPDSLAAISRALAQMEAVR